MKTSKSVFTSLVIAGIGTLTLQLGGCASDDESAVEAASTSEALAVSRSAAASTADAVASRASVKASAAAVDSRPVATVGETASPVTGGSAAAATDTSDLEARYPWVVQISQTGGLNCRGVLIHPSWVLTAAHCIGPLAGIVSYSRTGATTGATTTDSRSFDVNGSNRGMFPHPGFVLDSNFGQPQNDIALIRLAAPFKIDGNIQTAALPRSPANPGRTGTIATHNHVTLPPGHTALVRAPQVPAVNCTAPAGFVCINPATGSVCKGDSGSGFLEIMDGRATVVGVASNMSGVEDCLAAGGQVELADVYAYRGWILSTMNMSQEDLDGRVRLRWSGSSSTGIMSLECPVQATGASAMPVEVPMNVPGGEISISNCESVTISCRGLQSPLALTGYALRTTNASGATSSGERFANTLAGITWHDVKPGSDVLEYTCAVAGAADASSATTTALTAK